MPTKCARSGFVASFLLATALLCGCGSIPEGNAVFPDATIGGQPASVLLDTGSDGATIMKDGADRLKLKVTPAAYSAADSAAMGLTDPARLAVGTQTITTQIPVYRDDDLGFDMLIGWPQVRDNILVFDGVRRTVDAVDQVPAEACGWLQLKIFPYNRRSLYLKAPFPRWPYRKDSGRQR